MMVLVIHSVSTQKASHVHLRNCASILINPAVYTGCAMVTFYLCYIPVNVTKAYFHASSIFLFYACNHSDLVLGSTYHGRPTTPLLIQMEQQSCCCSRHATCVDMVLALSQGRF